MKAKRQHTEEEKAKIRAAKQATALRHSSMVVKCYELKINVKRLNKKQINQLNMIFLEGKWLYNNILSCKKSNEIPLNLINPTDYSEVEVFDKDRNKVVKQLKFLPSHYKQTIHARMISNEKTIRSLVKQGLQTHGSLKFKSELSCILLKTGDWLFKSKNKVKIMGVSGHVLVHGTDQFNQDEVEFANANLVHRPTGFFLKITTYINKDKIKKIEKNNKDIGLDFGVKTTLTTSEGEKIDISVGESDRTKILQKKLARQKKGSKNRRKTIKKLRISYQKSTNKKRDIANKFIHKMKSYSHVIFQDDAINEWHSDDGNKNKGKRRKVQHSCLGLIKAKLKAMDNAVVIAKFIPTSKFCRKCGSIKNDLALKDRTYECHCGHVEDRDVHAAKNMLWIWKKLQEENLVPMDGREVKLEDW